MKALIDGDILVYRCAFAAESTRYTLLDPESGVPIGQFESSADMKAYIKENALSEGEYEVDRERLYEPLSHALANVKSVMNTILTRVGTQDYHLFLSQGKCFRNNIATILEYKANRKDAPRPIYYDETREYLVNQYGARIYSSIEADDALAMCQTNDTVIVSIDKDLLQVPGKHYNWVKDQKVWVAPDVGLRKLYMQVLSGDPTDNIPGIRGVGEATARKMLADVPTSKKDLSTACTAAWDNYLKSDKNTLFTPTKEDGLWNYTSWAGMTCTASAVDIAAEVFHLVRVGGRDAIEALQEQGEELPLAGG